MRSLRGCKRWDVMLMSQCRGSTLGSIAWADHFAAVPGQAYKVSKAALNMLNKQYALDYKEEGFTFLCVSPGVRVSLHFHRLARCER